MSVNNLPKSLCGGAVNASAIITGHPWVVVLVVLLQSLSALTVAVQSAVAMMLGVWAAVGCSDEKVDRVLRCISTLAPPRGADCAAVDKPGRRRGRFVDRHPVTTTESATAAMVLRPTPREGIRSDTRTVGG